LRYELHPGQEARLVLEPWEHQIPLRGAEHGYTEAHTIRTWGRRRLRLIEPLLPFAERVDVYLKGRGLPSFYAVKLSGMTFILGLSGSSAHRWSGAGSFDLLADPARVNPALLDSVMRELAARFKATDRELADHLAQPVAKVHAALVQLCRGGRAIYDVETRAFRHRELFADPIDEAKLYPPDPRTEQAAGFLASNAVQVETCAPQETRKERQLKTPDGPVRRIIVYRDWRATGKVGGTGPVEIVVDDRGRVIFGKCPCAFFQEHLLARGPCEHMIALFRATEPLRADLPSSVAAPAAATPPAKPKPAAEDEDEGADDEEPLDDEEAEEEK
jgi:hypothetical protein